MSDFAKFERPAQLHLAFRALDEFRKLEGRLPRPYRKSDGARFVEIARECNGSGPFKVSLPCVARVGW